jgi:3-phosphoshikimate 1-carboxyvinyltransferase
MTVVPDRLSVEPLDGPLDVRVPIPGSKSLTNRALVCAALARGTSTLTGALVADDTEAMTSCLARLGADIGTDGDGLTTRVVGTAGQLRAGPLDLGVRLSGTTARFVLPVLGIGPGPYRLDGEPALQARPMGPAITALRQLGLDVDERGHPGHLPVVAHGFVASESVEVSGSLSSQFVSGLLLAAPCYRSGLQVLLADEVVSRPYVEMTKSVMAAFGVEVTALGTEQPDSHQVAAVGYRARDYAIEPDASAASYFFAAAALVGGRVRVDGIGSGSVQGDLGFVRVLEQMGASVQQTERYTEVTGTGRLQGIDVDLADRPDVAQTLAALAVFADGPTRVRGVGFIRGHETDRIAAVVAELTRCGIGAEATEDGFVVHPGRPRPAVIETYGDHRMAMSFALLGLRAPGIEIADPGCVAKTFPGYWDVLDRLRAGDLPEAD